jgi:hypothetical protein
MSEKIYALILRLYPMEFRERYGDEAIQLFRDRSRDEQGLFPTLRLWMDLLFDLFVSLPREHRYARPAPIGAPARQCLEGVPYFCMIEVGSPSVAALFLGGVLTLAALSTAWALIGHGGGSQTAQAAFFRDLAPANMQSTPRRNAPSSPVKLLKHESVEGDPPSLQQSNLQQSDFGQSILPQSKTPNLSGAHAIAANGEATLDAEKRHRVIQRAIASLNQYYFDHDVAQKAAAELLAHERSGDDNAATEGSAFAGLLTTQLRDASHDMHLEIDYSQDPLPDGPPQTEDGLARFRKAMLEQNCMFRKVEILPHNIGYLKLDFFADASVCGATATAAMASLNHTDAIIFDLRDNTGGVESMVSLIASYLFDHPEYVYGPRGAPTENSWTRSPVPGNRLADKPVYVLTSAATWSGAEQFSYDLKMLKRATLVGETTRGGAHAGRFHRIDDHFGMGIPEEKAINPFGRSDWEGVGVQPDVKVKASDALATAVKLSEARLQRK